MNNITAFTRHTTPVASHEEILNPISDPVRVVAINADGAWPVTPLPEGQVVVYDLTVFDEVERDVFEPAGYRMLNPETPNVVVQVFIKETSVDRVPRTETYAVVVDEVTRPTD